MEVILLEKIENLGALGDKVNVKAGYGRNYLLPHGKALAATAANLETFETRRSELEKKAGDALTRAQARAAEFADIELTIEANAGPGGKLFGSVGPGEIAAALTGKGLVVEKQEVRLTEALRQTGEFTVGLHLHSDVDVDIIVIVAELDTV